MLSLPRAILFGLLCVCVCVSAPAFAQDYDYDASDYDFDVEEIELADWQVAGDGKTPTFLQYLDLKGVQAKEARHLLSATSKGDVVYAFDLELPPAILRPSLTLAYSSETGMNIEMPYGWELRGIVEIRRPLVRAFNNEREDDGFEKEWLISGPGFSGTLLPSGEEDYWFYLKASGPTLVKAKFDEAANSWEVRSGGIVWTLKEKDGGASTTAGTALWRATRMEDASGNYVTYSYYDDGRIDAVCYGGNANTGEGHLVDVRFEYEANSVERTSARAGFVTTYENHVTKILVDGHESDTCDSTKLSTTPSGILKDQGITIDVSGKGVQIESGQASLVNSSGVKITDAVAAKGATVIGSAKKNDVSSDVASGAVVASAVKSGVSQALGGGSNSGASTGLIASGSVEAGVAQLGSDCWYFYDLNFTTRDSLDLFTKLEKESCASNVLFSSVALVETVAEFKYSEFDDSDAAARTGTAPSSLGEGESHSEGDSHDSTSQTTVSLVDFSGDGLPDVIDSADATSSNKYWNVTPQKVNTSTRTFSWDSVKSVSVSLGGALGQVTTEAAQDASTATRALTSVQLVDFDGDGYVDIVKSGDPDEWVVYYGKGDHTFDGEVQNPPSGWEYSQIAWAVNADHSNAASFTKDVAIGMLDFNGDGFLDLYDPAEGEVWLHDGVKGESEWGTNLNLTRTFEALRSVEYTIESDSYEPDISDYCDDEAENQADDCADEGASLCEDEGCEDYCGDYEDEAYDECMADCEDSCWDDNWDDYRDDCVDTFIEECEDSTERTRQKYIGATDEIGAFYDMNGDQLPDYVDSSATPWKVYLNNGHDFEAPADWASGKTYSRRVNEGRPDINYESNEYDIDDHEPGDSSRVYQMLIDVDGDGLLDLALGESLGHKWYKNTGTGFETASRSLPGWWPDDFVVSDAETDVNSDDGESDGTSTTTGMMTDLDHDGAVDYVYRTGVKYGPYPKPNLLIEVKNGQGGTTTAAYRTLATVAPAGDWSKEQKAANVKHLADVIFSIDGYTGQNAETNFSYEDGEYVDGVFRGFADRDVLRETNGAWTSETEYDYELGRDFDPLVTTEKLYVDGNLSFGSAIKKGTSPSSKQRFKIEKTYSDYKAGFADFHLLTNRKVTEYGESADSKSYNVEFGWDNYGNLTTWHHKGGAGTDDELTVTMSYQPNTGDSDDADFFRMSGKTVNGTDRLSGTVRDFQVETYYYDGNAAPDGTMTAGLLTKSEVSSGWTDGGEGLEDKNLSIEYGRGTRGEMISVLDVETGTRMDQTFGFGGAVLLTQTNALGQNLTRTLDARGRVTSIADDNGMKVGFSYDAFNRVTKKTVTGSDGKAYTLKTRSYERSMPYYDVTQWYVDDGSVENTSYAVEDGFGNVAQAWSQREDGHYLMTTRITDLRGLPVKSSHPADQGASFTVPMTSFGVSDAFDVSYHDALGETRERIRDSAAATGSQLVYHDNPRESLSQDEEGYQTKLTYDVHKRVTQVDQGKSGGLTTVAKYRYDPLDRLVRFEDGGGTYYAYSYDGAGRLRQVQYGSAALAATAWYSYEYKGMRKTKMTDATGGYAAWEYDALGRVTKINFTDSLPSATGALEYAYEYDSAWKGALAKFTDAGGTTALQYDAFGRPSKATRTYVPSAMTPAGVSAEIAYARDIRNRLTSKTLPSGKTIGLDYAYGHLSKSTTKTGTATDYYLTFEYNDWDLWSLVCSSKGHEFSRSFTTPLRPDELKAYYGGTAYERDYAWYKNDLVSTVKHATDSDAESQCQKFSKIPNTVVVTGATDILTVKTSGGGKTSVPDATVKAGIKTVSAKKTSSVKTTSSTKTAVTAKTSSAVKTSSSAKSVSAATASASPITLATTYAYTYDTLRQLTLITSSNNLSLSSAVTGAAMPKTIESYAYDAAGNLTSMRDNAGATWTYATAGTLNQIASRSSDKGGSETYSFDAAGRVSKRVTSAGTYEYYYDGLGRLRGVTLNGSWQAVYDYDEANNLLRIGDNNPYASSPYYVYNFRDWRFDEKTGVVTEEENAFVSTVGGARTWKFHEYDGHVAVTMDDAGAKTSSRVSGGYGNALSESGTPWDLDSYHGAEDQGDVFRMGQRHLTQEDGTWLQPEPYLYLGIPSEELAAPRSLATYRYALNSPTAYFDAGGFDPETVEGESNIDVETEVEEVESVMETVQELNEAGDKKEALGVVQNVLDHANPTGSQNNCASCAIATALTLRGTPATCGDVDADGNPIVEAGVLAGVNPDTGRVEAIMGSEVQNYFNDVLGENREFVPIGSLEDLQMIMSDAGDYSSGIVTGFKADGSSHTFNVINMDGNIRFIDGQNGGQANLDGYNSLFVMTTSDF